MNYKQFYQHLIESTLLWIFSLAGFALFIHAYRIEMSVTDFDEGLALAVFIPLFAFCIYYYFMLNTFTHNIKNSLLLPTESNIPEEIIKFVIICLDLFLYTTWQIEPMDNTLIWFFLIFNGVFLIIYFLSIKISQKEELNQYYLTQQKANPQLSLLIVGGALIFSLLSLWNNFIVFPVSILYGIYISVKINHFFNLQDQKSVVLHFLVIFGLVNMIFWLSASITHTTRVVVDHLALPSLLQYIPTIFFGVNIAIMFRLKFYNMCQQLTFIPSLIPETGPNNLPPYYQEDISSPRSNFSQYQCPQCDTKIDESILSHLSHSISLFCPHCGNRIFQHDLVSKTPQQIVTEHQKILTSLNQGKMDRDI
ncbi:hypothetical protein [Candidatus Lokiarchaeum ossiferum]